MLNDLITPGDSIFFLRVSQTCKHIEIARKVGRWVSIHASVNDALDVAFGRYDCKAVKLIFLRYKRPNVADVAAVAAMTSAFNPNHLVKDFGTEFETLGSFGLEFLTDEATSLQNFTPSSRLDLSDGASVPFEHAKKICNALVRQKKMPTQTLHALVKPISAESNKNVVIVGKKRKRDEDELDTSVERSKKQTQRNVEHERVVQRLHQIDYPNHFLRPPYQQPPHTNDAIEFMIVDMDTTNTRTPLWEIEKKYEGAQNVRPNFWEFYVRLFGVTAEGRSVCAYLSGWNPFVYVQVPSDWNMSNVDAWIDDLEHNGGIAHLEKNLVDVKLTRRINIYGYTKGTRIPVVRLYFAHASAKKKFCARLKINAEKIKQDEDARRTGCGRPEDLIYTYAAAPGHRFWLFDSMVDNRQQFVNDTNIAPCRWVRLPSNEYAFAQDARRPDNERRARTQIDVDIPFSAVKVLSEREDVPPMLIESWDLEVMRGKRDRIFPNAQEDGDEIFQSGTAIHRFGDDMDKLPCYAAVHCSRATANVSPDSMHVNEFADERELLRNYAIFTRDKVDADVRITFNGYGFDNKYWEDRAEKTLRSAHHDASVPYKYGSYDRGLFEYGRVRGSLSRCREAYGGSQAHGKRNEHLIPMIGRVQLDLFKWSSEEWKMPRKLNFVAKDTYKRAKKGNPALKEDDFVKKDLPFWEIHDKFVQNSDERGKIADYCRVDTEVPLRILCVRQVLLEVIEVSRLTGITMEDVINKKQMARTFAKMSKYAHDRNYMIPEMPERFVLDPYLRAMMFGDDTFEGATVIDPKRGFYETPIATLDFAGLYPSIIRGWRLCYTTIILDPKWLDDPDTEYTRIEIRNRDPTKPPYVLYWCTNWRPLLYDVVTDILDARTAAKAMRKKHVDNPFLHALYDARQKSLKVVANSLYGFTGAKMNKKLPCLAISATVTHYGREMIEKSKKYTEETVPGSEVIYGDTDSIMIRFPREWTLERVFETSKRLAAEITTLFPDEVELEFEKVYLSYLLWLKKNYAGLMLEELDGTPVYAAKGIASVRGDKIGFVKRITDSLIQTLLYEKDASKAIDMLRGELEKLVSGDIDASELVQEKKLTKALNEYPANTVHVQVARAMEKRDPGTAPRAGEMVAYVVVRGPKKVNAVDFKHYSAHRSEYELDMRYYLENLVVESLGKLLDLDGLCADPFRLFAPYIARVRSADMGVMSLAQFGRPMDVDGDNDDEQEAPLVPIGRGNMLTKMKMRRDKDRRKKRRKELAKAQGVRAGSIGKGSLAGFFK